MRFFESWSLCYTSVASVNFRKVLEGEVLLSGEGTVSNTVPGLVNPRVGETERGT